jgi:hypothetical protein
MADVSGLLTILTRSVEISNSLVQELKEAPKDIQQFLDEIRSLAYILEQTLKFHDAINEGSEDSELFPYFWIQGLSC